MISMIDVESLLDKLLSVSYQAALPIHGAPGKTTKGSQGNISEPYLTPFFVLMWKSMLNVHDS